MATTTAITIIIIAWSYLIANLVHTPCPRPLAVLAWQSRIPSASRRSRRFGIMGNDDSFVTTTTTSLGTDYNDENNNNNQQTTTTTVANVHAVAYGVRPEEVSPISSILKLVCDQYSTVCSFQFDNLQLAEPEAKLQIPNYYLGKNDKDIADNTSIFGPTGRVVFLSFDKEIADEEDVVANIREEIGAMVDQDLYSEAPHLQDPFLLSILDNDEDLKSFTAAATATVAEKSIAEVIEYAELQIPLPRKRMADDDKAWNELVSSFVPGAVIEVDGAMVNESPSLLSDEEPVWDTSRVYVFDGLVSPELRKRLAQVVAGKQTTDDDDDDDDDDDGLSGNHSPDSTRWERGGLSDRLDGEEEMHGSSSSLSNSYGLTYEAIQELCFEPHDAIEEMEIIISQLFSDFIVTRLPEAVMGESVSPLTANAPVAGDEFEFHIDGDPALAPPSFWTDIYGRYPNRSRGKPRFVSLLIYLNDEWQEEWGAPTRFLDVATDTEYAVTPRPGRCIVMDQDVTHSVTAPSAAAGKRARYSLVWKLILHPTKAGQDMRQLSCGRAWPDPILIGSANK